MLYETEYSFDVSKIQSSFDNFKTALNTPTGDFFYDTWEIKPEFKNTIWDDVLKSLPYDIGEARIINLAPGNCYLAHADIDDRYHLTISAKQAFLVDLDNQQMYPTVSDNKWYTMNTAHLHSAVNFGDIPRIQLVVRHLLMPSSLATTNVTISPAYDQYDYRYKFDNYISPWLNRANKLGHIKKFTYNKDRINFDVNGEFLKTLKLTNEFKIIVTNNSN